MLSLEHGSTPMASRFFRHSVFSTYLQYCKFRDQVLVVLPWSMPIPETWKYPSGQPSMNCHPLSGRCIIPLLQKFGNIPEIINFFQIDLDFIISLYALLDFDILGLNYFSHRPPVSIINMWDFVVVSFLFRVSICCFGHKGYLFFWHKAYLFFFFYLHIWLNRGWKCHFVSFFSSFFSWLVDFRNHFLFRRPF